MKRSFWVPYEDASVYPTHEAAVDAIAKYCGENNWQYAFGGEDEVVIDGIYYEIYRGYESGSRGNYGIKCKEK